MKFIIMRLVLVFTLKIPINLDHKQIVCSIFDPVEEHQIEIPTHTMFMVYEENTCSLSFRKVFYYFFL